VTHFALLIYNSLDTLSGGYLYDRMLVEALQRGGDTVEVVSLPWRAYARCLGDNLSAGLLRRLAGLHVDLLLQDELNHPSLFWLNRRLRLQVAYPFVSIVHHLRSSEQRPAWQNHLYRWVERRYLASVNGFIYNSQTTCQAIQRLVGAGRPTVIAYPAGDRFNPQISEVEIARRAQQPGPLRIFFLGNIIPRKGLHTLLEALSLLPDHPWTLDVAGGETLDAAYSRQVHRQAKAFGDQVRFLGPLNSEELAHHFAESQVLAVPSSYEGFGIVYLEGMSFGLPALATTAGAAGEIITHGQDGFLVAPGDSAGLAGCIQRLAEDRERLLAMSLAARRRFLAHPSWQASMARAVEFLHTWV
jgi:glycosyltransferase involved in cell wall biosynthesis